MREYEIYIPLKYNDGRPIETTKLDWLQSELLEKFDGVTYLPQPNQGLWRMGGVVFRDEVVIYRIIAKQVRRARTILRRLKQRLKADLQQEEILIVERIIETL